MKMKMKILEFHDGESETKKRKIHRSKFHDWEPETKKKRVISNTHRSTFHDGESETKKRVISEIDRSEFHDWESESKRVLEILTQAMKLQEMKIPTQHEARINTILRHVSKLQEEITEELELMKKLEEEKKLETMKKLEEEKKLENMKKLEEKKLRKELILMRTKKAIISFLCSGDAKLTYDRDSTNCYPPEELQRLKDYAKMAMDLFNQRQPIKYNVVDVDIATRRLVDDGYIVHLIFTAKPDPDDKRDTKFGADIHCGTSGLPEVTYVERSSLFIM